ncbi:serine hydroxymethyltransferase [archaeon]|nr:serine hydroxymethyltransferase [archaeon]
MYETNIKGIEEIVKENEEWRSGCINLIASENVTSKRVRKAMASDLMHRYAEGHPGERYYRGTGYIDRIETGLKEKMKKLFSADNVDVRPICGTNANQAIFGVYTKTSDIAFVNSTPGGGHISHHKSGNLGMLITNIKDLPLTEDGYHIDIEDTKSLVNRIKPKILVLGKSLFLFPEPIKELEDVCKENKVKIIYDAAHVLGLIAGKQFQDPLSEGADIITGSTHKTFFGTQRGVILSNVNKKEWSKIDKGAFPGSSSNHHLDTLAGLAIATNEMLEFGEEYAKQTIANAKSLAVSLDKYGFNVQAKQFGYTMSHQIAVDVAEHKGGNEVSKNLEKNDIIINMNLLPDEEVNKAKIPKGIRIGVQEMTRFGMKEPEMEIIAELIKKCIIDEAHIKEEVNKFRDNFQNIEYSHDN